MLSACGRGSAREVAGPVNRSRVETGNGAAASGLREDITRFNIIYIMRSFALRRGPGSHQIQSHAAAIYCF